MTATVTIKIRVKREDRELVDRASAVVGLTRSEFVRRAALREAQDMVLDQTHIAVGEIECATCTEFGCVDYEEWAPAF